MKADEISLPRDVAEAIIAFLLKCQAGQVYALIGPLLEALEKKGDG